MYQFPAAQQTITAKLPASNRGFKLKSGLYSLMGLRLLMKMLLMEVIFVVKVTMNIETPKKRRFGYSCRSVSRALTIRLRNTFIYVFRAFFDLPNVQYNCCCLREVKGQLFHSTLHFDHKGPVFMASQCTSKPMQRIYLHFFKYYKLKTLLCKLMRLRLLVKVILMDITLGMKVTTNIATMKKLCFFSLQICNACFNPYSAKDVYLRF